MLTTASGKGVRAEFRCLWSRELEGYAWEQEIEGSPFAKVLEELRHHGRAGGRERRHAGDDRGRPAAARAVAAGRLHAAARDRRRSSTRRSTGLEQALGGGGAAWLTCRPMRWWGWGDPQHRTELPPAALAALRAELGAPDRTVPPVALEDVRLGEPALPRRARSDGCGSGGEEWVRQDRLSRVTHAAGKGYPDLVRMRAGRAENAPGRGRVPGERRARCARCSTRARRSASPWSRSAAAPAWWAASSRCAGRWLRAVSLDLGADRPRRAGRHALADRRAGGGPARARRRARARAARPHARALPAVVGVRDARRMGRHPFRRPGLDRVRQHREAGRRAALRRAVGRDRASRPAGDGGRPGAAPAAGRLGGRAGRHHRGDGAGAAAARPTHYEGWMFQRLRAGRGGVPRAGAGPSDPRPGAALGRGRDAPGADPLRGRLARAARGPRLHRRAPATRRAAWRSSASRARARTSTAAGPARGASCGAAAALALGAAPGRAWLRQRYEGPYLRDALLDHGIMVETLETAAPWSGLLGLYEAVRAAIARRARGRAGRRDW